jgi:hypothetical protein
VGGPVSLSESQKTITICILVGSVVFKGGAPDAYPVDLDFLGESPFRCEGPANGGWIYLDFLGFSRVKLDLSMGYTA